MSSGSLLAAESFTKNFIPREFTRKGGTLQMAQLWVNLRAKDKSAEPGYQTLLKSQIPTVLLPHAAGRVRVIAGEFDGEKGPAPTFTPINLWDVNLTPGKSVRLSLPDGHTTKFLVHKGEVVVNGEQETADGALVIFARKGDRIAIKAKSDTTLLVMSGEPAHEPIVGQGTFVMNSRAEIQQAFKDYQLGRMGELALTD